MTKIKCPVCKIKHPVTERYPLTICEKCLLNYPPITKNGRNIKFINDGYKIISYIEGNISNEKYCYINGILCEASPARSGTVVI